MFIVSLLLFVLKITYHNLELEIKGLIKYIVLYLLPLCNFLVLMYIENFFFYLSNVKIVPYNIYGWLTPKGLAFWIMYDGSKHETGLHISVYAFSNSDVDKLMFTLQDKFNLKCSIHYNRENKPRIYLFKESMDHLITLVKPYFIN